MAEAQSPRAERAPRKGGARELLQDLAGHIVHPLGCTGGTFAVPAPVHRSGKGGRLRSTPRIWHRGVGGRSVSRALRQPDEGAPDDGGVPAHAGPGDPVGTYLAFFTLQLPGWFRVQTLPDSVVGGDADPFEADGPRHYPGRR